MIWGALIRTIVKFRVQARDNSVEADWLRTRHRTLPALSGLSSSVWYAGLVVWACAPETAQARESDCHLFLRTDSA